MFGEDFIVTVEDIYSFMFFTCSKKIDYAKHYKSCFTFTFIN